MEKTERELLSELTRTLNELSNRAHKREQLMRLTEPQLDFLIGMMRAAEGLVPRDKSDQFAGQRIIGGGAIGQMPGIAYAQQNPLAKEKQGA